MYVAESSCSFYHSNCTWARMTFSDSSSYPVLSISQEQNRSETYVSERPLPARRRLHSAEDSGIHVLDRPQYSSGQDRRRLTSTDVLTPVSGPPHRIRRSPPLLVPMDNHAPHNVRTVPELDVGESQVNTLSDEYDLCEFDFSMLHDTLILILLTLCSSP